LTEEDHLEYILEKERKTIKKFEIDHLGYSKGNFSDFDVKPIVKPIMSKDKSIPNKKIKRIRKDPNKPAKRSDKWFPLMRVQD